MTTVREERMSSFAMSGAEGPRRIAVDWDGTCVPDCWPEQDRVWIDGAVDSLKTLVDHGFEVVIFSSRVSPAVYAAEHIERDETETLGEIAYIRSMLDEAGLPDIEVWTRPYKPSALAYVDNRGVTFTSWDRVLLKLTSERHPNSARFHELLTEAGDMHDRKQLDYGKGDDPFANVRATEEWGVDAWIGAMVRLSDKVKRLQSLSRKGYLANEAAKDSFIDIAVYALIAYVLFEQGESS